MTTLCLALLLALPARAQDAFSTDREARLVAVSGPVYVHLSGQAEDAFVTAEEGMPVDAGDEIRTGAAGAVEIALDGTSLLALGENSQFSIGSLRPQASEFSLQLGTLLAKIKSLAKGEGMRFRTPTVVAAVRGTELGISEGGDEQPARVAVFDEGQVAVSAEGQKEVVLGPNEETEAAKGGPLGAPRKLAWWKALRGGAQAARDRAAAVRESWKSMTPAQRRTLRRGIMARRAIKRKAMKGLAPGREDETRRGPEQRQQERRENRRQQLRKQRQRAQP
jgi:hypothetical protein